jgi:hypothetical protein
LHSLSICFQFLLAFHYKQYYQSLLEDNARSKARIDDAALVYLTPFARTGAHKAMKDKGFAKLDLTQLYALIHVYFDTDLVKELNSKDKPVLVSKLDHLVTTNNEGKARMDKEANEVETETAIEQ